MMVKNRWPKGYDWNGNPIEKGADPFALFKSKNDGATVVKSFMLSEGDKLKLNNLKLCIELVPEPCWYKNLMFCWIRLHGM